MSENNTLKKLAVYAKNKSDETLENLNSFKVEADTNYAKKTDVTNVYKVAGSVENLDFLNNVSSVKQGLVYNYIGEKKDIIQPYNGTPYMIEVLAQLDARYDNKIGFKISSDEAIIFEKGLAITIYTSDGTILDTVYDITFNNDSTIDNNGTVNIWLTDTSAWNGKIINSIKANPSITLDYGDNFLLLNVAGNVFIDKFTSTIDLSDYYSKEEVNDKTEDLNIYITGGTSIAYTVDIPNLIVNKFYNIQLHTSNGINPTLNGLPIRFSNTSDSPITLQTYVANAVVRMYYTSTAWVVQNYMYNITGKSYTSAYSTSGIATAYTNVSDPVRANKYLPLMTVRILYIADNTTQNAATYNIGVNETYQLDNAKTLFANFRVSLSFKINAYINSAEFVNAIPAISLKLSGNLGDYLGTSDKDIFCQISSSNTSYKEITIYARCLDNRQVLNIQNLNPFGSAFSSSSVSGTGSSPIITSNATALSSIPTPAQGSTINSVISYTTNNNVLSDSRGQVASKTEVVNLATKTVPYNVLSGYPAALTYPLTGEKLISCKINGGNGGVGDLVSSGDYTGKYRIGLRNDGKNLWNNSLVNTTSGVLPTSTGFNILQYNPGGGHQVLMSAANFFSMTGLKNGDTFTISYDITLTSVPTGSTASVYCLKSGANWVITNIAITTIGTTHVTKTVSVPTGVDLSTYSDITMIGSTTDGVGLPIVVTNFKINRGSVELPYSSYITPTTTIMYLLNPLRKSDYFDLFTGSRYTTKGVFTFNSSVLTSDFIVYTYSSDLDTYAYYAYYRGFHISTTNKELYSNNTNIQVGSILMTGRNSNCGSIITSWYGSSNGYLYMQFEKTTLDTYTGATTADKIKAYFTANPITIEYSLDTPTQTTDTSVPVITLQNPEATYTVDTVKNADSISVGYYQNVSSALNGIDTLVDSIINLQTGYIGG